MIIYNELYPLLRKIAKSNYWQMLFSLFKEGSNIDLFENRREFSYLQIEFFTYLIFYNSLEFDISMGDVNSKILDDIIYEDAYMYYKNESRKKKHSEMKKINPPANIDDKYHKRGILNKNEWVFTKVKGTK